MTRKSKFGRYSDSRPVVVLATVHLALLILLLVAYRTIGESWWVIALVMYHPHWLHIAPLTAATVVFIANRRWKQLLLSGLSLALVLGPVMGLCIPTTKAPLRDDTTVRVYSQNVQHKNTPEELLEQLVSTAPDIVLLQEATTLNMSTLQTRLPALTWTKNGQFVFGTRFVLERVQEMWTQSYVRYELSLGNGFLTCLNIHPGSISGAVTHVSGLSHSTNPRWRHMSSESVLRDDLRQRLALLRGIAQAALASGPVIVAGDTNLPGRGTFLSSTFAGLTDAFEQVGTGWGYTFPSWMPWLRLDRVWVGGGLVVKRAVVANSVGSDHLPLVVELTH